MGVWWQAVRKISRKRKGQRERSRVFDSTYSAISDSVVLPRNYTHFLDCRERGFVSCVPSLEGVC